MTKLTTRASSINRALDQIGDKWCLLIIQEVFWGISTFGEMKAATGVSKGVLSDRLKWLVSIDCLHKEQATASTRRPGYYLTEKSAELYASAMMAVTWERKYFSTPALDAVTLVHQRCGQAFKPQMHCGSCDEAIKVWDVSYKPGPGARQDERDKKVRRRSSISLEHVPSQRSLYKNLINIVGDRWTSNLISLSFHGLKRFDEINKELPVATNILADRLKFLVNEGIFEPKPYQERPVRYEYHLSDKGKDLFPWFLTLLQWGDKWCDSDGNGKPMKLTHTKCNKGLVGLVQCSECGETLDPREVSFDFGD